MQKLKAQTEAEFRQAGMGAKDTSGLSRATARGPGAGWVQEQRAPDERQMWALKLRHRVRKEVMEGLECQAPGLGFPLEAEAAAEGFRLGRGMVKAGPQQDKDSHGQSLVSFP